jgi:hypothetical protein
MAAELSSTSREEETNQWEETVGGDIHKQR